jgi:hypothetical protein
MKKSEAKIDPSPIAVVGKIAGINGTPNDAGFYTSAGTSYNIQCSIPKQGVTLFERQVPQFRLWTDDTEINAARLLGVCVFGVKIGREVRWFFSEPVATTDCQTQVTQDGGALFIQGSSSTPAGVPSTPSTPTDPNVTPTPTPDIGIN